MKLNRTTLTCKRIPRNVNGKKCAENGMQIQFLLTVTFAMLTIFPLCRAQAQAPEPRTVASIDSAIEVARADMSAERRATISAWMQFTDKDGAAFWPVYRKYESERAVVDDLRVIVIKEYAEKYLTMTDADAKAMTERMFEYDSRDLELKRKYFKEFNKVLRRLPWRSSFSWSTASTCCWE